MAKPKKKPPSDIASKRLRIAKLLGDIERVKALEKVKTTDGRIRALNRLQRELDRLDKGGTLRGTIGKRYGRPKRRGKYRY